MMVQEATGVPKVTKEAKERKEQESVSRSKDMLAGPMGCMFEIRTKDEVCNGYNHKLNLFRPSTFTPHESEIMTHVVQINLLQF